MPNFIRVYKIHLILFFVALMVQLLIFFLTMHYGEGGFLLSSDAEGYFEIGKSITQGKGFVLHQAFGPQALRPPLYPLFIAVLYRISPNLAFIVLVQNILAAIVIVGVYSIGLKFFNQPTAIFAALLFLFESQRLQVTNQIMSETVFTFFFMASIYYVHLLLREKRLLYAGLAGLALGLAALTRPVIQYLPFIYTIFLLLWWIYKKEKRFAFSLAGILIIVYTLTLSPWLIRNKVHFDTFAISATGGANLYYVNAAHFLEAKERAQHGTISDVYHPLVQKAIKELEFKPPISGDPIELFNKYGAFQFKYDKALSAMAIRIIAEDPWFYVRLHAKRTLVFLIESSASHSYSAILDGLNLPPHLFYPTLYWGGRFFWGFLIFLALIGAIRQRMWRKEVFVYYSVFGVTIFYFAVLAGLNYDAPRMRLPVNPLLFLLISYSILLVIKYKKPIYASTQQEVDERYL